MRESGKKRAERGHAEAKKRICEAARGRAGVLDLYNLGLTTLPPELCDLKNLTRLYLWYNQLSALPPELGELKNLTTLYVGDNQLTALPPELGKLRSLTELRLERNLLTVLPPELGKLKNLTTFYVGDNRLTALPPELGKLKNLTRLHVDGNRLTALPPELGELRNLTSLYIGGNRLTTLPPELGKLRSLTTLMLGGNSLASLPDWLSDLEGLTTLDLSGLQLASLPDWLGWLKSLIRINVGGNRLTDLPPGMAEKGTRAILRYLRERAKGAAPRYEAKLLVLGHGKVGKTCVVRALRGEKFQSQTTTIGMDVQQWKFPHPSAPTDRDKQITLNIWDFEGQEIGHQTLQFFLDKQSLYLLVFSGRDQFRMDQAEYWLDTVRARAPGAKVALVITECEHRAPLVPLDQLQSQHGDMFAEKWLFPVGCETDAGIPELREFLEHWAASLEMMGQRFARSYAQAEAELRHQAKDGKTDITRADLFTIFRNSGISTESYEDAAERLSAIGVITQFPDCQDLSDFVVLRPQWLAKAVSMLMGDERLRADKGEIAMSRMQEIWDRAGFYGKFSTFHLCMKEFELCYDLDDPDRRCLVPLRFDYLRPNIPWTEESESKTRRVEYKLNMRPPMGIMSRFIVKAHHMIVKTPENPRGVCWHNGVFLGTGDDNLRSEALCEFVPEERKLRVEVRAAFPQNMCEQVYAYIKAAFAPFTGLQSECHYGCIKVTPDTGEEVQCKTFHSEKRIYSAIAKQRVLDREIEDHDVEPIRLVSGLSSFQEFAARQLTVADLRRELDKRPDWAASVLHGIKELIGWVESNDAKLDRVLEAPPEFKQEVEAKLREYLTRMDEMLDDRD